MTVELPDTIARLLPGEPAQQARRVLEDVVVGAFTQGHISRGRACELLGLDYWAGEKLFTARGLFTNYDLGEFQHDLGK